jgi:hypothetical protein
MVDGGKGLHDFPASQPAGDNIRRLDGVGICGQWMRPVRVAVFGGDGMRPVITAQHALDGAQARTGFHPAFSQLAADCARPDRGIAKARGTMTLERLAQPKNAVHHLARDGGRRVVGRA